MIQDEASQLVTSILDPKPGEQILDACAAPGGKTTHIAQRMKNEGEIVANDLANEKLSRIDDNCQRLGVKIVKPRRGDAAQAFPFSERDGIRSGACGCSLLRFWNPPEESGPQVETRGEKDIRRLSELQSSILENVSRYVKEGGVLVYSTCTVFREENEAVVEKFLEGHPEFRLDRMEQALPEKYRSFIEKGYFRTFPSQEEMDGFFAARLIKE